MNEQSKTGGEMATIDEQGDILAIAPYTIRTKDGSAMVGDLFITKKVLCYVPLQPVDKPYAGAPKGLGTVYGALQGGIIGAALGTLLESDSGHFETPSKQDYINNAVNKAFEKRREQYGFSLQERMNKTEWKDWVTVIPKESIFRFESLEGGIILCITTDKRWFIFTIPKQVPGSSQIINALRRYTGKGAELDLTYTKDDDFDIERILSEHVLKKKNLENDDLDINRLIAERRLKESGLDFKEENSEEDDRKMEQLLKHQEELLKKSDQILKEMGIEPDDLDIEQPPNEEEPKDDALVVEWPMPPFGLNLSYPTPLQFIEALKKGESPSQEMADKIADDDNYMDTVSEYFNKFPKDFLDSLTYTKFITKLGEALYRQAKPYDALKCFRGVLKREPQSIEALMGIAASCLSLNDTKAAEKEYDKVISIDPKSIDAWFEKGAIYFKEGVGSTFSRRRFFEKALKCFDEVIKLKFENDKIWIYHSACLYELGEYANAITSGEEAIKFDAQVNEAWFYKGMSEYKLKKFVEAKESLGSFLSAKETYNILNKYQIEEAKDNLNKIK